MVTTAPTSQHWPTGATGGLWLQERLHPSDLAPPLSLVCHARAHQFDSDADRHTWVRENRSGRSHLRRQGPV
jgi:hypothetical protein